MPETLHPLAPLTFPLHGSRLIEASAGTGKTWTIAALSADGRFAHYVEALYAPLVAWVAQSVQVIAWEQLEEAFCSTLNHKTGGTTPAQT